MPARTAYFLLFAVALCVACGRSKPPIPEPAFIEILTAYHIASAYGQGANLYNGPKLDTLLSAQYQFILAEKGYTPAQLRTTFAWYQAHPKAFEAIYDQVIQQLTLQQEMLAKPQNVQPVPPASAPDTNRKQPLRPRNR
jgi:Domain of unknown function (DUF4296)